MDNNQNNIDNNIENEIDPNISETRPLTNDTEKIESHAKINIKSIIISFIIILASLALLIILFLKMKYYKTYSYISKSFNYKFSKNNPTKINKNIYSEKWIVLTIIKNPINIIKRLSTISEPWKIVIIERGKISKSFFENYNSNKIVYLSIEDQKNLGFQTTNFIPIDSYARKNIGYLFAIQHGAKEIYDIDEDFILENSNILNNIFTNWRLYYANNISQMINPYEYFGRPDIWPRGFRLNDIHKNNTNNFFSAVEHQFTCKPLIFQGIAKNFDLDSIFLNTRENIFKKNQIKINLHLVNPLLYIPGNFVPINSKNTRILYDVFPALALPTSVSNRVSDIWRGYLMQRYAWGYDGLVLFTRTTGYFEKKIENISSIFEEEKDLFFKLDRLLEALNSNINLDTNHPANFFIKLIEILVEKNILKENDLNMYKAFIFDLESFGYNYKNNYKISIDSNFKNYLNISSELQYHLPLIPDIHINKKINTKLLRHFTFKKKYDDILLIINYNYEFLLKLNSFLLELYQEYFPNIVFISPGSNSTGDNVIACPESYKGYYSYFCIKKAYDRYPNMKGYLFIMDDVFVKVWELEKFNFDIPWILSFYINKTKNWPKSNDREEEMLNKNKNWQKNLRKFYNSPIIGHGISDFFYVPKYFFEEYITIAKELFNYKVFLELAVPSIYGIISKPIYQYIYFSGLWNDNRKNWLNYLRAAHTQTVIHPIKFSDINNQKEVIKYLFFKNAREY